MRNISLKGVDDELTFRLQQVAKDEGKSVNQVILDTLRQYFGLDKANRHTRVYNDLDALFGNWSPELFARVQARIDDLRPIDPELWK